MAQVKDASLKPLGYVKITGLSAAQALTPPVGARYAMCKTETQPVRYRDDGTNPSATDGMLIDVGDEFWYSGDLTKVKFLETAVSATLHVSFYR